MPASKKERSTRMAVHCTPWVRARMKLFPNSESRGSMRRILVSCVAVSVLTLAVLSIGMDRARAQSKGKLPKAAQVSTYGNTDAISEDELKVYDYFLASDQLEGRNFPSRGYDTAALFVASHLAEWGLKPGGSATGAKGPLQSYFMPIELEARQVAPEESKASLSAPAPAGRGGFGGGFGGSDTPGELRTTTFAY